MVEVNERVSQDTLLEFSREHLEYELHMLYGVSEILKSKPRSIYVYNAMLESYVIHASNILDFFYKPQNMPGDAKAVHYIKDVKKWRKALPPYSRHFRQFNRKRNREVMHLSYKRLSIQPDEKKWGSQELTKQIKGIVDLFLDFADPDCVHPNLYELHSSKYKLQE